MLDHVIGRFTSSIPALITSSTGIRAKLYGHWIRANHPGNLMIINPVENEDQSTVQISKGNAIQNLIAFQDGLGYAGAKLTQTSKIETDQL